MVSIFGWKKVRQISQINSSTEINNGTIGDQLKRDRNSRGELGMAWGSVGWGGEGLSAWSFFLPAVYFVAVISPYTGFTFTHSTLPRTPFL